MTVLPPRSPLLVSDADADGLAEVEVALGHGVGGGGAQREHHVEHLGRLVERALPVAVVRLPLACLECTVRESVAHELGSLHAVYFIRDTFIRDSVEISQKIKDMVVFKFGK